MSNEGKGAIAPTHDASKGMDVDFPNLEEDISGSDEILETLNDHLSLPNLDTIGIEVRKLNQP